MIRRLCIFALAQAIAAGNRAAADEALAAHDPLLRWLAQRRLVKALTRAASLTSLDDEAQRCRLAVFIVAGKLPEADYDDVAGIAAEVDPLVKVDAPRRGPWASLAAAMVAILLVAGPLVAWRVLKPFDPLATEPGGIFGELVPAYVVALNSGDGAALANARAAAEERQAGAVLGEPASARLDALFVAGEALKHAPASDQKTAADAYFAAGAELNHALADQQLPYFVDADVWDLNSQVTPVLLSFYVERERHAQADAANVRVVHLWRLDRLNLRQNYLGYTRRSTPAALVLLDQIEAQLVRLVLPPLAADEPMWIVDEPTRNEAPAWAVAIEARAGAIMRQHHLDEAALDDDARATLAHVGELLARRRALISDWRQSMAEHRRVLHVPERLLPEGEYSEQLHLLVPTSELVEWDAIHDELLDGDNLAAFVALRDRYAEAVERHEIQHKLDYETGLSMPALVADRLGVTGDEAVGPETLAGRTRDELSAYLASLAQSDQPPIVGLTLMAAFILDAEQGAGPYAYAALVAMEGIAEALGIDGRAIVGDRRIRRAQIAELLGVLADRPSDALRRGAADFYQVAFERPLPTVAVTTVANNPRWRH